MKKLLLMLPFLLLSTLAFGQAATGMGEEFLILEVRDESGLSKNKNFKIYLGGQTDKLQGNFMEQGMKGQEQVVYYLDKLGQEGWRVVSVYQYEGGVSDAIHYLLKRERPLTELQEEEE